MSEFFNMGGYAAYIWPAYGISALVLIGLIWQSLASYRHATREVAGLEEGTPVYSQKRPGSSDADPGSPQKTGP